MYVKFALMAIMQFCCMDAWDEDMPCTRIIRLLFIASLAVLPLLSSFLFPAPLPTNLPQGNIFGGRDDRLCFHGGLLELASQVVQIQKTHSESERLIATEYNLNHCS